MEGLGTKKYFERQAHHFPAAQNKAEQTQRYAEARVIYFNFSFKIVITFFPQRFFDLLRYS